MTLGATAEEKFDGREHFLMHVALAVMLRTAPESEH